MEEIDEYVLTPSGRLPEAFQGRSVVRIASPSGQAQLKGRSHLIGVYESTSNELIVEIIFQSEVENEDDFCFVERDVNLAEIPDLLACYDPLEHLNRKCINNDESIDARALNHLILKDYDLLRLKIEQALDGFSPTYPPKAMPEEPVKQSLWNRLGFVKRKE